MADLEPARLHAQAIKTLAEEQLAELGAALTVYDDQVPADPAYPYAVLWSGPATAHTEAERMAGWGQDVATVMQATVAGLTVLDVLGGADRLMRALHRRTPTIAGRIAGDIEVEVPATRPTRDPVVNPDGQEVWALPVLIRLLSNPITNQ